MKLPMICVQCMHDDIATARPIGIVGFRDDGRYEVRCENGHSSVQLLQQQKFEILFEIGAFAIKDGYFREAVSSFTSSLERCYELFIRAALLEKKLGDALLQAWKEVSSQSERQLGAFILLYTSELGRAPALLPKARVTFRNEVIHKGRIPTREEAVGYGQAVLDVIRPLLIVLKERYPNGVGETVWSHLASSRLTSDSDVPVGTICLPTIVSLSNGDPARLTMSLEDALDRLA